MKFILAAAVLVFIATGCALPPHRPPMPPPEIAWTPAQLNDFTRDCLVRHRHIPNQTTVGLYCQCLAEQIPLTPFTYRWLTDGMPITASEERGMKRLAANCLEIAQQGEAGI